MKINKVIHDLLKANLKPTPAQKTAGNYKKDHREFNGLKLSIENPAGSIRKGVSKEGKAWETKMQDHYGYIKGVTGQDKEHLDIFLNPEAKDGSNVYIIDQRRPADGVFDEHKVMIGYNSKDEAVNAYQRNYDPAWTGLGSVTEVPLEEFKTLIASGKMENKFAKKETFKMKFNKSKVMQLRKAVVLK